MKPDWRKKASKILLLHLFCPAAILRVPPLRKISQTSLSTCPLMRRTALKSWSALAEARPTSKQSRPGLLQDARYVIKSVICDPNFEGLVLGCMDSYDSKSRLILQRFSNCTWFCSWTWGILQSFAPLFKILSKFRKYCKISLNFAICRCKFHRFFPEFRRMIGNCSKSMNFEDFSKIFADFSGKKLNFRDTKLKKVIMWITYRTSCTTEEDAPMDTQSSGIYARMNGPKIRWIH